MKKYVWAIELALIVGILWWFSLPKATDIALRLERDRAEQFYPVAYADWVELNGHQFYLISPFGEHSPTNNLQVILSAISTQEELPSNQIKVIRGDYQETELAGIRYLVFNESVYDIGGSTPRLISSHPISKQHHIEKNQGLFTLTDLFKGYQTYVTDAVAKALENHPRKDELLTKQFDWSPLEKYEKNGIQTDGYTIRNGYKVFDIGVSLPLSAFHDVIDPSYLKGNDLLDYQTLQNRQ
ncbi:hypothetical protein ACVRZR_03155 [Streptococcus entericus]|uniref:hypothetical protein n=1 Tax=Streptococcus entericus TaxID=155680 RepID=UPI00036EF7A5|nr:hypothetical protein [Streptococcus entericus]